MLDENKNMNNIPENSESTETTAPLSDTIKADGYTSTVSGVETVTKKKKGKKIAVISAASAAVLVGGSIIAYNFSPFVKNQVKLRTMEPEKYYAWVNEENAENFADSVCKRYKTMLDQHKKGQSRKVSLKYEASDEGKEYLLNELIGDDYDDRDDEGDKLLQDIIKNNDSVSIDLEAAVKKTDIGYKASLLLDDEKLISTDIAYDMDSFNAFARIPELTEKWMGFSLDSYIDKDDEEAKKILDAYKKILSDPASVLSPKDLKKEILKYTKVWNDSIDDIKIKKDENVSIGDITVKYTVVSLEIDEKLSKDIGKKFIKELRKDDIIKGIVIDKLEVCTKEEYEEFCDEELADIEDIDEDGENEWTDDEENEGDFPVNIRTYIDPKGNIRGIKASNKKEEYSYILGKKGKQVRGEIVINEDEYSLTNATIEAEETSKDEYSGSIEINYTERERNYETKKYETVEKTATVDFSDFKIVNDELCTFNADIKVEIPDLKSPISVTFSGEDNAQSVEYDLIIDGTNYGKFTLRSEINDSADFDFPDEKDAYMIDPENVDDLDINDYVSEEQVKKCAKEFMIKLGVDEKTAEKSASEFAAGLFRKDNRRYLDEIEFPEEYNEFV